MLEEPGDAGKRVSTLVPRDVMEKPAFEVSLRDLVFIMFKRKWEIALIFFGVVIVALFWLLVLRAQLYEAHAKILVKIGHEQASPATVIGQPASIVGYRQQDVNSEVDILNNKILLGRLVEEFNLDRPSPVPVPEALVPRLRYEIKRVTQAVRDWREELFIGLGFRPRLTPQEKAVAVLEEALSVTPKPDSNVIIARLALPDRKGVSVVLSALVDHYLAYRLTLFQDSGAPGFFEERMDTALDKLQRAEDELRDFEGRTNIITLDKQKELLLGQIAESEIALRQSGIAMNEAHGRVERLEKELKSKNPDFAGLGDLGASVLPDTITSALVELEDERERLRMTQLDSGDRIENNRRRFRTLLSLLASNLRSVLSEKQQVYGAHKAALASLKERLNSLHQGEMEWVALKRKVRVLESEYLLARQKLMEASTGAALGVKNIGTVAVIERPTTPVRPKGVGRTTLLAIAIVLAMLASMAWASIAEFFDHRVYTSRQLGAHLQVPVVSVIPDGHYATLSIR